jgi:hypothetical protein
MLGHNLDDCLGPADQGCSVVFCVAIRRVVLFTEIPFDNAVEELKDKPGRAEDQRRQQDHARWRQGSSVEKHRPYRKTSIDLVEFVLRGGCCGGIMVVC